jgi:hypothetical protein
MFQGIVPTKVSRLPAALVACIARYARNPDSTFYFLRGCEVPTFAFFNSQRVRQGCCIVRMNTVFGTSILQLL